MERSVCRIRPGAIEHHTSHNHLPTAPLLARILPRDLLALPCLPGSVVSIAHLLHCRPSRPGQSHASGLTATHLSRHTAFVFCFFFFDESYGVEPVVLVLSWRSVATTKYGLDSGQACLPANTASPVSHLFFGRLSRTMVCTPTLVFRQAAEAIQRSAISHHRCDHAARLIDGGAVVWCSGTAAVKVPHDRLNERERGSVR